MCPRTTRRPARSSRSRCSPHCASSTRRSRSALDDTQGNIMSQEFDPKIVARTILAEHASRADYRDLPPEIAPANIAEAYAAQLALVDLSIPHKGRVAGLKIATTTKVM